MLCLILLGLTEYMNIWTTACVGESRNLQKLLFRKPHGSTKCVTVILKQTSQGYVVNVKNSFNRFTRAKCSLCKYGDGNSMTS